MMHEEEDDETIFDQQGLLDVKRKKSKCDFFWYQRFTKTVALSLAFFALGLCISIPGATLLDLKERTGTDVEKISIIFTARSLGYLVGSIFGGVLFDYYDQQILLFYTLVLTGIATIFVPWCTALTSLACMIASHGLAMGVLDTGGNMFCIRLWNKGSAPYMQVLHFSFAVGAFLAPLLARPFLLDRESIANHTFPQSHIPVNIHPSSLSSAMGPRSLHNHDVWWLETAASQHRVLRDVSSSMEGNYKQFVNIGDEYYDILKEDFGEQSEQVSDGVHVNMAFASGEKGKDHIISYKDDSRPIEDSSKIGKAKLETVEYNDIFWFLHRAKRQTVNSTISPLVNDNVSFVDTTETQLYNVTASTFPITTTITTQAPRAAKPAASNGIYLNKDFADGEKGNKHINSHKDDPRPQEDNSETDKENSETVTTANPNTSLMLNVTHFDNGTDSRNVTDDEENSNAISLVNGSDIFRLNNSTQIDVGETVTIEAYTTSTPKTAPSTTSAAATSTYTKAMSMEGASKAPYATSTISVSTTVSTAGQTKNLVDLNLTVKDLPLDNTTATVWAKATTTHPFKPQFNNDIISSTIEAVKNMSNIQFAYMIIGFVLMGNAAFFLLLYCRDCHARRLLHQVAALGPNPPPMSSCFRCSILCLLFIFFLFYVGMEVTFGGLVTTFAVESPLTMWTRQQGATLVALFWGSIAAGRGLAIFIARFFKPPCMLVADLTLMLSGAIMLSFALQSSAAMLWVGTVTLGLGMSSVFPTAVSWADVYYPLTGRATAVFITGSGVGEMVIPVVTGYLFENYDSMCLMYIVLGFSCLVTAVFVVLQCIAWRNPLPASAFKQGFMLLASEEENGIGMQDLDDAEITSSRSTGYTENARRRQAVKKFVEDAEEETSKLMDSSD